MRCVPGNHDLGDGSGELPMDPRLLGAYREVFGPHHLVVKVGHWKLLGINAQLLGSGSVQELALWQWIEDRAGLAAAVAHTALFLRRPLLRQQSGERVRKGRYVPIEWAAPAIDGQYDDLHRDDGREPCGSPVRTAPRGQRDRDDARDKERPHDGVRQLDSRQDRGLDRRGWMIWHEAASRVGKWRCLRRIA